MKSAQVGIEVIVEDTPSGSVKLRLLEDAAGGWFVEALGSRGHVVAELRSGAEPWNRAQATAAFFAERKRLLGTVQPAAGEVH